MKRNEWKKTIAGLCLIICLMLLTACGGNGGNEGENESGGQPAAGAQTIDQTEKETAAAMISGLGQGEAAGPGCEWSIIAIEGSSLSQSAEARALFLQYEENLRLAVKRSEGVLSEDTPTDNAKAAIAAKLMGLDPGDIEGYDLLKQLEDVDAVRDQGINAEIWSLIAAACCESTLEAQQTYLQDLLKAQDADGAVTYDGKTQDVDITAMAMQALAPYGEADEDIGAALRRAQDWLAQEQTNEGDYGNAESTAQVIIALGCLGEDPASEETFIKEGNSLYDGLMKYHVTGGFCHRNEGTPDAMATEQSLCALDAIRLAQQGRSLFKAQ